jgi:hypothetical protein
MIKTVLTSGVLPTRKARVSAHCESLLQTYKEIETPPAGIFLTCIPLDRR